MDRYVPIPFALTEPLTTPYPPPDMTFGECVGQYAPTLLKIIAQANEDRQHVRIINGREIRELLKAIESVPQESERNEP